MPGSEVNHAVVEHMVREHEQLTRSLNTAQRMLSDSNRDRAQVNDQMLQLSELVEFHFRHEEEGGYLAEVLERAPRLGPKVEELRNQHDSIQEAIDKIQLLVHSGVESHAWWSRIESDFQQFATQLMNHEHAETKLVQQAFNQDVGTGD